MITARPRTGVDIAADVYLADNGAFSTANLAMGMLVFLPDRLVEENGVSKVVRGDVRVSPLSRLRDVKSGAHIDGQLSVRILEPELNGDGPLSVEIVVFRDTTERDANIKWALFAKDLALSVVPLARLTQSDARLPTEGMYPLIDATKRLAMPLGGKAARVVQRSGKSTVTITATALLEDAPTILQLVPLVVSPSTVDQLPGLVISPTPAN